MTPGTSVMRVLVIGAGTWVALSCATTPNAPTVGSVALQSTADTVAIGDSIALTAAVRSDGGTLIDIPVSWSSSEPSVASTKKVKFLMASSVVQIGRASCRERV